MWINKLGLVNGGMSVGRLFLKYLYYAQFQLNDHQQYEVTFPDFGYEGATYGNNITEALQAANESLTGLLLVKEDYGERTPKSSTLDEISKVNNGLLIPIEVLKSEIVSSVRH